MGCPRCGGADRRPVAPGYFQCTSVVPTSRPAQTPSGMQIIPSSAVCGHRYQPGRAVVGASCGCGTYAVGVCAECGRGVCGDHSHAGDVRTCTDCDTVERERVLREAERFRTESHDRVIATLTEVPDPLERLLRVAWYLVRATALSERTGASDEDLHVVVPELDGGTWETTEVADWFLDRAAEQGLEPPDRLSLGVKRFSWTRALAGHAGSYYEPGPSQPAWRLPGASTHERVDDQLRTHRLDAYVLPDAQVLAPAGGGHHVTRHGWEYEWFITSVEPTELTLEGLGTLADLLGYSVDQPEVPELAHLRVQRSAV